MKVESVSGDDFLVEPKPKQVVSTVLSLDGSPENSTITIHLRDRKAFLMIWGGFESRYKVCFQDKHTWLLWNSNDTVKGETEFGSSAESAMTESITVVGEEQMLFVLRHFLTNGCRHYRGPWMNIEEGTVQGMSGKGD